MGYSGGDWVSPYTYKALLAAVPVDGDGGAAAAVRSAPAARTDNEWLRGKQPLLFLRLDIARGGEVELQPSFAFPARPRTRSASCTPARSGGTSGRGDPCAGQG
jgi:hypothetical protein